jgi:hypothetical protein
VRSFAATPSVVHRRDCRHYQDGLCHSVLATHTQSPAVRLQMSSKSPRCPTVQGISWAGLSFNGCVGPLCHCGRSGLTHLWGIIAGLVLKSEHPAPLGAQMNSSPPALGLFQAESSFRPAPD